MGKLIRALLLAAWLGTMSVLGVGGAQPGGASAELRVQQELSTSSQDFPLVVQTLHPGWNLVGWAGASSGPEAFDFVTGPFEIGFTYNAGAQAFESFSPDAPPVLNSLGELEFGDGVWIFTEEETTWVQPAPWWQRDVALRAGFNLVLWTGGSGTPVGEAVAGLGSALETLSTWDPIAQAFLSYGPDRPDFLNTADTLNYGDGVWIEVNRAVTWEQPALQRVGTQDAWFIRKISKVDGEGNDIEEITNAVLQVADDDLGPPIPLRFGLVFQEARSLSGLAQFADGSPQDSVRMTVGLISRDLSAAQVAIANSPADVFLGENLFALAAIASPHLDEAQVSPGREDLAAIDFEAMPGIEVGDQLAFEYVFAQTREVESLLLEESLTDVALFARRWNAGHLSILAMEAEGEARPALVRAGAEIRPGSALATFGSKTGAVVARGAAGGAIGATVGLVAPALGPVLGSILGTVTASLDAAVDVISENVASVTPPLTTTVIGDGPPHTGPFSAAPPPAPEIGRDSGGGREALRVDFTIRTFGAVAGELEFLIQVRGGVPPYRVDLIVMDRDILSGALGSSVVRSEATDRYGEAQIKWIPTIFPEGAFDVRVVATDSADPPNQVRRDRTAHPIEPDMRVTAQITPTDLTIGEEALLSVSITGIPTQEVLTPPFDVTIFDDRADLVQTLLVDEADFELRVSFTQLGRHFVTVTVEDEAGLSDTPAEMLVHVVDPAAPDGPHWVRVSVTPNGAEVEPTIKFAIGANNDSESTCTPSDGSIAIHVVIASKASDEAEQVIASDLTFTWTFDPPPAVILEGVPALLEFEGEVTGEFNAPPGRRSGFEFLQSVPVGEPPEFRTFNPVDSRSLRFRDASHANAGSVDGSASLTFGAFTPVQMKIRANASGHHIFNCTVDYVYEFRDPLS